MIYYIIYDHYIDYDDQSYPIVIIEGWRERCGAVGSPCKPNKKHGEPSPTTIWEDSPPISESPQLGGQETIPRKSTIKEFPLYLHVSTPVHFTKHLPMIEIIA